MTDQYILKDGVPVQEPDLMTWAQWLEDADNDRQIEITMIGDVRVSTVFLGLDHSFGVGPPLLYETLVFDGEHDGDQDRYSTLEEAQAGHARMVEMVTSGVGHPACYEAS